MPVRRELRTYSPWNRRCTVFHSRTEVGKEDVAAVTLLSLILSLPEKP